MLTPAERLPLLEALRPPDGYRLDRAVGTTYSLDLMALLFAPLAFTTFDARGRDGESEPDPIALLESLRRHARRIHLFCQAGRIQIPRPSQRLLAWLEDSVIEARVPRDDAAFHAKVWAIRYVADEASVRYRFLCLSRNLTFDRSWDTAVVLDGALEERSRGFARNRPLGDFFAALPDFALRDLPPEAKGAIRQIGEELRRVRFELPEGFEELSFWPLGIAGASKNPLKAERRRLLVVSPFLSPGRLGRLAEGRPEVLLVSRAEALDEVGDLERIGVTGVWTLNGAADLDTWEGADHEVDDTPRLNGLHAKLYVVDDGWNARIFTGSANATEAAFTRNVEFLVELVGKKSRCGIDALLEGPAKNQGLMALLVPYKRVSTEVEESARAREMRLALDRARDWLALSALTTRVEAGENHLHRSILSATRRPDTVCPPGVKIWTWPATLPRERAAPFDPAGTGEAVFEQLSFEALTAFFCFDLVVSDPKEPEQRATFALNTVLEGAPEERHQRLLHGFFRDPDQFLRFLLLLLADDNPDLTGSEGADEVEGHRGPFRFAGLGASLLEGLLRALARSPRRLDEVRRILEDLDSTPEGKKLIPPGLVDIWLPIWEVRQRLDPGV